MQPTPAFPLSGRSRLALPAGLIAALALATPAPTHACGGMVFESHLERPGGMDGQEIFLALTPSQSVLVLSASFIESEGDKAFLLPLAAIPDEVRDADETLFVALDNGTAPFIEIEDVTDYGGGSVSLCAKSGDGLGRGEGGTNEVEVLARGMTATYEFVVVGGDSGMELATWLDMAGFAVPTQYEAALEDYASSGWYFLAAKLNTDIDAGRLAPLELHLPPMVPAAVVPFGLASYGLAPDAELDVTLYLASEATILPQNYALSPAPASPELVATSATTSNYQELFDTLVGGAEPTWVVEYSDAWSPSELGLWLDQYDELIPEDAEVDAAWLGEFSTRLDAGNARLTRLRARLGADELSDLELGFAQDMDADRFRFLAWDEDNPTEEKDGCGVIPAPEGGLLGFGLFGLGLFGLRRRRLHQA